MNNNAVANAFSLATGNRRNRACRRGLFQVVTQLDDDDNKLFGHDGNEQPKARFMYMTHEEDRLLKEKGDYEQSLMRNPVPLKPHKVRRGAGGFGGGGGSSKTKKNTKQNAKNKKGGTNAETEDESLLSSSIPLGTIQSYAKVLATDGLVRIDNVLEPSLADELRDYLCDLRTRSIADVENGRVQDSQERFADVLLNQNRCDLKIPLGPPPVNNALYHLLARTGNNDGRTNTNESLSIVRKVVDYVFESYDGVGKDAELWESNCFMSNSGARRQLVHADNVCLEPVVGLKTEDEPIILTCFVALQDIDATMGPTVWMPGTHTLAAHNQFFETGIDASSTPTDSYSPKDAILKSSNAVVGTIPKGACVIFDPRVLHCAGSNTCADPDHTRALFYVSVKNPKIDNPGCPSTSGYGIATAAITLEELTDDLVAEQRGEAPKRLPLISCFP